MRCLVNGGESDENDGRAVDAKQKVRGVKRQCEGKKLNALF
jgi:hypothetical protein